MLYCGSSTIGSVPWREMTPTYFQMEKSDSTVNIIASHYKIIKKIGEGSFGIIYQGRLI
jgi:hypothetical protein